MNGQDFLRVAGEAFAPFLIELGFVMDEPSISGRFYRVSFTGSAHTVSISYEPYDDAAFIMIFSRVNGRLSDIDDRAQTPRLADLNARYMKSVTSEERAENDRVFELVVVNDNEGRALLKAAKELRLVIPRYLEGSNRASHKTV